MTPAISTDFEQGFRWLQGLYPHHRPRDNELVDYWKALHDLDAKALRRALFRALDDHPKYFPSAGEIRVIAKGFESQLRAQSTSRPDPEPYFAPSLAPDHPMEVLAQDMEREARERGLELSKPPPGDVGKRWAAEINHHLGAQVIR